jgi:hypothetical protein
MKMVLIKIGSPEWEYMWNWLAEHPLNEGLKTPSIAMNEGEAWQYMGSFKQNDKIIHSFRHRCHPRHGQRVELHVEASDKITDEDIEKEVKMK